MTTLPRTILTLACALVLASPAAAGDEPRRLDSGPETEAGFELHSGFWINLHHFLYEQALLRGQADGSLPPTRRGSPAPPASLGALSEAERREWSAALDVYAGGFVTRDLLFNERMIEIKNGLAAAEGHATLERAGLEPDLRKALERAAPVYRAHFWADHDCANRAWIGGVRPLLKRHGAALQERTAAAFRAAWPPAPIRVDVTSYANWAGAYTTLEPLHVTVSSVAPGNEGPAALETLLHETSHALVGGRRGAVAEAIDGAFTSRKHRVPRDLWHAILFFTTGELARRALAQGGVAGYEPYAYKGGLYDRSPEWGVFRRALEAHWLPYLDGKIDFETAVGRVAEAVVKEGLPNGRDASRPARAGGSASTTKATNPADGARGGSSAEVRRERGSQARPDVSRSRGGLSRRRRGSRRLRLLRHARSAAPVRGPHAQARRARGHRRCVRRRGLERDPPAQAPGVAEGMRGGGRRRRSRGREGPRESRRART